MCVCVCKKHYFLENYTINLAEKNTYSYLIVNNLKIILNMNDINFTSEWELIVMYSDLKKKLYKIFIII